MKRKNNILKVTLSLFLVTINLTTGCIIPSQKEKEEKPSSWSSKFKITAVDMDQYDYFGNSVSISGDYAIAGAYKEEGTLNDMGATYIYYRSGLNTWDTGTKISAYDGASMDMFGSSVSISGDYAAAGSPNNDHSGSVVCGAVYVFHRTGTNTWDAGTKIIQPDTEDRDTFGCSVSISGDYLIVGAELKNGSGTYRGAAYVFKRTGENTWDAGFKLTAESDTADFDYFGNSVSISGNYAAVGAHKKNGTGNERGAVYVYQKTGISNYWAERCKITAPDAEDQDQFGSSVSISGDYLIVGAIGEDGSGTDRGAAYIFRRTGTNTWEEGYKITAFDAGDNDLFGFSVSISGDYAICGAYQEEGFSTDRGAAYIYKRTGINEWLMQKKLTSSDNETSYDYFGYSVSINNKYAVIGAESKNNPGLQNTGAAYIFMEF